VCVCVCVLHSLLLLVPLYLSSFAWSCLSFHSTELLAEQLEEERRLKEKLSAKARMLAWIRERCYLYDVEVTDFRETFRNGKAFAALVASCSEGFEFKEQVSKPPAELLNDTFEYADSKLGIPQLVRVSDLVGAGKLFW